MKKIYKKIKILILGDSYIGKSTLVNIIRGKNDSSYSPTIFDNVYHYLETVDENYHLDIRDTSGSPEYTDLITTHLADIDVAILCFSVDNSVSFYNIRAFWFEKIRHVPVLLLGLKIDLRYEQKKDSKLKIISHQEGKELGILLNCPYLEFCQTDNAKQQLENATQIFEKAITLLYQHREKEKQEKLNEIAKNKKTNKKNCLIS